MNVCKESEKQKMDDHNLRFKICLVFSLALLFYAFLPSAFATESNEPNEPNMLSYPLQADAGESKSLGVLDDPNEQIKQICSAIYKGDFAGARRLLGKSEKSKNPAIAQLIDIISEYEVIEKKRQSAREAAYKEQLIELEKLSSSTLGGSAEVSLPKGTKTDFGEQLGPELAAEGLSRADANDTNDVNDASSIPEALVVIAKACEFADDKQKEALLFRPFVKQTIKMAIDKAAEYESKGKWLDAYITCYSWLQAIEPNNQAYSDHADQLVDKANIVITFQDSPCETRQERFQGVQKEIFLWAIDFLEDNYVDIIDYKQMAVEAINRCKLLAEVTATAENSKLEIQNSNLPSTGQVAAWSSALSAVLDEVNQSPAGFDRNGFTDVFNKVLALNSTTVELPQPVLIAHFAEAALSALDSYTVIVWPKQMEEFQKVMTSEFTGIGIEITKQKGLLTVVSLLPDTPAYNSGLDAGDVIEKVDGVQTKDMTLICAVHKITGPAGTKVTLTVRREGQEKTEDITITRARITIPTLYGWQRKDAGNWLYMIDQQNKIAYVRITSFSQTTSADLEKVLNELEAEDLKGLILDLRFNSGGLLDSAVSVADKFLKEGLIVSTERGFGKGLIFEAAHAENTHPDYPIVILINTYSASASEIVAGALADAIHDRAILVGQRTHGKGSVQGVINYPRGDAQLKYTMANYHLPSGRKVESRSTMKKKGSSDWGVGPDIEIKLTSAELKKLIDIQRDNDVLAKAGRDNSKLKKHTIEETLSADPQLAVAALVIKAKLIESEAKTKI